MAYDYIVKVGADVDGISEGIISAIRKADGSKIRIKCEDKEVEKFIRKVKPKYLVKPSIGLNP